MTSGFMDLKPDSSESSRILIVDDLPERRTGFKSVLDDLGQPIVFVPPASDELRDALRQEFAVILFDLSRPGIEGLETARLIRQNRRSAHTPILFMASSVDAVRALQVDTLGAIDVLPSPVLPDVLRSKVRLFIDMHLMQRRLRRKADERVSLARAEAARASAEEATRRSEYLSHASRILSGSLEVRVGMRRLLELLVPHMALGATVAMIPDQVGEPKALTGRYRGDISRWEVAGAEGQLSTGLEVTEHRLEMLPMDVRTAFARAMVMRQAVDLPEGSFCRVIVPLVTGERSVGGLLIQRLREPADWRTLDELANRAAIAFENARLYRTLQVEIEDRRLAEARLLMANQRKDEFLAMLSHELRNPLAPIRNALEVIRRVAPPDPKLNWATDVTGRQIGHLTRLVDELLDVARISQGKISLQSEPLDLRQVVTQAVDLARPLIDARGHALKVQLPDAPVWLRGDAERLVQVVGNLLNNAAKYTQEGGCIDLTLSLEAGRAVVSVRDNGTGIEPELLPNVFDLFEQGKRSIDRTQGGLGVGLTLVERLVQLHHGRVEARSDGIGRGADFRVILPCLSEVQAPALIPEPAPVPTSAGGYRVLVVDDNLDAAESTAVFLQVAGHEVMAVHDGAQALGCVQSFSPDVIVLDIGLPEMDGYEVARRLRRLPETARAFLVAVTGYGQIEDRQAAIKAGFDEHLTKPADPARLIQLIGAWKPSGGRRR